MIAGQVGARLRAIRDLRRMSALDVQVLSGGQWSRGQIQFWEKGARNAPVESLAGYAAFLGVPVLALFPGEGDALFERAIRALAAASGTEAMVPAVLAAA